MSKKYIFFDTNIYLEYVQSDSKDVKNEFEKIIDGNIILITDVIIKECQKNWDKIDLPNKENINYIDNLFENNQNQNFEVKILDKDKKIWKKIKEEVEWCHWHQIPPSPKSVRKWKNSNYNDISSWYILLNFAKKDQQDEIDQYVFYSNDSDFQYYSDYLEEQFNKETKKNIKYETFSLSHLFKLWVNDEKYDYNDEKNFTLIISYYTYLTEKIKKFEKNKKFFIDEKFIKNIFSPKLFKKRSMNYILENYNFPHYYEKEYHLVVDFYKIYHKKIKNLHIKN